MPDGWDDCHRVLSSWIRPRDLPDQASQLGLGGLPLTQQIIHQHRIGKLQEAGKRGPLLSGCCGQNAAGEALEQHIELLHTTTTTPQETASFEVECRCRRHVTPHVSALPLDEHFLDLCNRTRWIEVLGAHIGAIHDGVAAIEPERILELVEPLARRLVAAVDNPTISGEERRWAQKAVAIPPIARAGGRAARTENARGGAVNR